MEMEHPPNDDTMDLLNSGDDVTGLEPHILDTAMTEDDLEENIKVSSGTGDHNAIGHLCHICVNIPYEAVNLLEQTTGLDAREARKAAFTLIRYMKENRHTEEVQNILRYISDSAFGGSSAQKEVDEYYTKLITASAQKDKARANSRMHELNETFLTAMMDDGEDEQDGIYPSFSSFNLEEATVLAQNNNADAETNRQEKHMHVPELLSRINVIKEESGNADDYYDEENAREEEEDEYGDNVVQNNQECQTFSSVTKINRRNSDRHTISSVTMTMDLPLRYPKYAQTEPVVIKRTNKKHDKQVEFEEEKRIGKSSISGPQRTPQHQALLHELRSPVNGLRRLQTGTCSEGRNFGSKKHYYNRQSFGDNGRHGQHSQHGSDYVTIPLEAINLMKKHSGMDGRRARKAGLALIHYMKEQRHTDGVQNLLKFISGSNSDTFCVKKLVDSYEVNSMSNLNRR